MTFSDYADWASVAGLAISVCSLLVSSYAALGIKRVRNELINRATLPALSKALDDHIAVLGTYLQDYEQNRHQFSAELARCSANLTNLSQKLDPARLSTGTLGWKIARYQGMWVPFGAKGPQNSEQHARAIYDRLITVQQKLLNFLEDQRFR